LSFQPLYIQNFEQDSGLITYFEPSKLPESAFPVCEDAIAWRGRIRRRRGFSLLGRLRRFYTSFTLSQQATGTTVTIVDLLNDANINVRSPSSPAISETYGEIQASSPDKLLTIVIGANTFTDNGDGTLSGGTGGSTIDYVTGGIILNYSALGGATNIVVTFAYYPALPVMGLRLRQTSTNNVDTFIAFDQKYAYNFVGSPGQFQELTAPGTTWRGNNSSLFWTTNYWFVNGVRLFWATNYNNVNNAGDPIRYFDNSTWTNFTPKIDGSNTLYTCLILVPFKNRLLAFNTWEGPNGNQNNAVNFPNRLRWSINGDPTVQNTAWRSDTVGTGGFLDIPTQEEIISVEFMKDVLLVKCERSSWKLTYTGNPALPFLFEKVNTEFGAESTFSLIPFDDGVLAITNYGVTVDNSVVVQRIDQNIPDIIDEINDSNAGIERVYGIRDFVNQLAYFAYPDASSDNQIFNNKVLVYNYVNKTWAIFNDSWTCFGYYQSAVPYTWGSLIQKYPKLTWGTWHTPWGSGFEEEFAQNVIAGNQQGFVEVISDEDTSNDDTLAITNIGSDAATSLYAQFTVINHNFQSGQVIFVSGIIGRTLGLNNQNPNTLNNATYQISVIDQNNFLIQDVNGNNIPYPNTAQGFTTVGTYLGGGRITPINNINVFTKIFAPFYTQGQGVKLGYVDFLCDRTAQGQFTVNLYLNENNALPLNNLPANPTNNNDPVTQNAIILTTPENTDILPFQAQQNKIWHRFFSYILGENFQMQITMSTPQMFGLDQNGNSIPDCPESEITINSMVLYFSNNARLTP